MTFSFVLFLAFLFLVVSLISLIHFLFGEREKETKELLINCNSSSFFLFTNFKLVLLSRNKK
jgi:hypothetical protein